jgi:hypothetical protein
MKIGDLVQFVGSSQLYFNFPTDQWYHLAEGDAGIVINIESNVYGLVYRVQMLNSKKNCCWFYDDELCLLSRSSDE